MADKVVLVDYRNTSLSPFVPITDEAEKDSPLLITNKGLCAIREELIGLIEEIFE